MYKFDNEDYAWAMPAVTDDITAILTTYLATMHGIIRWRSKTRLSHKSLIPILVDDGSCLLAAFMPSAWRQGCVFWSKFASIYLVCVR
jgi:hypothetical protein